MEVSIKNWVIRAFGLKGSWSWAKRQMLAGKMIRQKNISGQLKYRLDSKHKNRVCWNFSAKKPDVNVPFYEVWESANHFLSDEDATDYEVFEWPTTSE